MGILAVVFAGFILAAFTPWITRSLGRLSGWMYALVPTGIVAYLATYTAAVQDGGAVSASFDWVAVEAFTVSLSFYLDGLSLFFALLISGVGALIYIYAGAYLEGHHHLGRFFSYLSMFMASMIGMVLADNLLTFYIFFEGTSFASFMLIGFNHYSKESRRSAWQALLVTKAGGLALLVGFVLMYMVTGTYQISEIIQQGALIQQSEFYVAIVILVLAGAFTKSAQFPFYFWLPNAMKAPTPVSAYLHSATMVKAGIYVMARLHPALSGTDFWVIVVTSFGALTMLLSAWLALQYTDMKGVLAYTTVMALGLLTMLLGIGSEIALKACMLFVLVHALYKATLFMITGAVDHGIHVRDITKLSGLRHKMPITAAAAGLAALSMAGIPPFFGFIGKEIVYEAALNGGVAETAIAGVSVLANIALVAGAGLLALKPFWGSPSEAAEHAHQASVGLWFGPVVLAAFCVLLGLFPGWFGDPFLGPAVGAVMGEPTSLYLVLWHGFTIELLLSAITVASGVALYFATPVMRNHAIGRGFERAFGSGLDRGYDRVIDGILGLAKWQTRLLQNGVLRYYMATILGFTVLLVGGTFLRHELGGFAIDFSDLQIYDAAIALLIVSGAISIIFLRSRLAAVVSLGISGIGIALVYLTFGAPDLAMTQFLVETLTVILFALVLIELPNLKESVSNGGRIRDALIAVGVGAVITGLMLVALQYPFDSSMANFYAVNTYTEAEGRNIVNTILVDFRAIDTLGEIVVLMIAGFGIYTLLSYQSAGSEGEGNSEGPEGKVDQPRRETLADAPASADQPAAAPASGDANGADIAESVDKPDT